MLLKLEQNLAYNPTDTPCNKLPQGAVLCREENSVFPARDALSYTRLGSFER